MKRALSIGTYVHCTLPDEKGTLTIGYVYASFLFVFRAKIYAAAAAAADSLSHPPRRPLGARHFKAPRLLTIESDGDWELYVLFRVFRGLPDCARSRRYGK